MSAVAAWPTVRMRLNSCAWPCSESRSATAWFMLKPTVPKRPGCSYCWCASAAMSIAPFMFLKSPTEIAPRSLAACSCDPRPVSRAAQCQISLVLVPVAIAVFAEGGYSAGARVAFGLAAVCAGLYASRRAGGATREPVVVVLLALAALAALSALWTLGPAARTLRWALVCAGYAGVVVAAAAVARRRGGVELLAGAVAAIAFGAGLARVVAALLPEPAHPPPTGRAWGPGRPLD